MARKIRQSEIARISGVSVSTVSRVMNGLPGISAEVREHVQRAAESLGLKLETPLRTIASSVLVLAPMTVLSSHAGQFHTDILSGVSRAAGAAGVSLTCMPLGDTVETESALARADGVILLSVDTRETIEAAQRLAKPVVLLNALANADDDAVDVVLPDNFGGGAKACRFLTELGHDRIACLMHSERETIKERFAGARSILGDGAPCEYVPLSLSVDDLSGKLKALLDRTGFTALLCSNDITAIAAMQALGRLGLSVPGDVSIVGFDDLPPAALSQPPLTTIRIDREALGGAAFRQLLARIENHAEPAMRQILSTELVERHSTAPPAQKAQS